MSIDPATYRPYEASVPDRRYVATRPGIPSDDVIEALEDGLVNVIRRVELYESNGETLWNPDEEGDPNFYRIIDGNVNLDYNSDERRTLDLTLDNTDLLLRADSVDGLWYDKIVKVFRGVSFVAGSVPPKVAIAEAPSANEAKLLKKFLSTLGFIDIEILTNASIDELRAYPVIFSFTANGATTKSSMLKQLWNSGNHVFTIGTGNTTTDTPHYFSTTGSVTGSWRIEPANGDTPVAGTFASGPGGTGAGRAPLSASVGVTTLALGVHPVTSATTITAALATSSYGGYWVDLHLPQYTNTQVKLFLRAISDWIRGIGLEVEWETQVGEFMIDGLNWAHFPDQVKITGRDYTKKMKQSKLAHITTFAVGTKLRDLVVAMAANSGIDPNKMRVGISNEVLTTEMTYDAGTERWQVAKEACDSFNYEIFFDAFGWFVVRKFLDPYESPLSWVFKTGEDGNLVSFDKSLTDSEIYNHVIVTATPSEGDAVVPYFGEAENHDSRSPTNIERLGDRVLIIEADYLTSDAECVELARARLKISALEQYALNATSIYYPWMEVGEIVGIDDPDASDSEPKKYLLDSLGFPIGLGPMSGTAKRITLIDPDAVPEELPDDGPGGGGSPPPNPDDPPPDPDDPTPGTDVWPSTSVFPALTLYPDP